MNKAAEQHDENQALKEESALLRSSVKAGSLQMIQLSDGPAQRQGQQAE